MATITADSIPVYNYSYAANLLNPSGAAAAIFTDVATGKTLWTCADWITYFNALSAKFGEKQAKDIWSYFWNLGVDKTSGGAGDLRAGSGSVYSSVPDDCKATDTPFRTFLTKYNLTDVVYKGLGGVVAKPIGVASDLVTDATNAVEGAGSAVSSIGKIIKYGVPIALVAIGVIFIIKIYKSKALV